MARGVCFESQSWSDYQEWQARDPKLVRKINELIEVCRRTPFEGMGKPEALKGDLKGYWSRRITDEHRLVYRVEEACLVIKACKYHYSDR